MNAPAHSVARAWHASLALGFSRDADTTRLTERAHTGPLRVQKPLYPEGPALCHVIVVHPPGGVAGGDRLEIRAQGNRDSAAFITTPGASKWYKANGSVSQQHVMLRVAEGASMEWLPQETILFDAAHVRLTHTVELAEDASYIGGEILCFGRTAAGERFASGRLEQRTTILRAGKPIWFEQGGFDAGDGTMHSPLGLAGKTVCATLMAAGRLRPGLAAEVRAACDGAPGLGATQMKSLLVVRYLGDSSETAKQLMTLAWQVLRKALLGRDALMPRIWNT